MNMTKGTFSVLAIACLAFAWTFTGVALGQMDKRPYRFDCGATESNLVAGAIRLTESDIYDPVKRFGWTNAPLETFLRDDLRRSRNDFTIDGVLGNYLDFQADLPPGKWFATLWVEAGMEDSSTVTLNLNGRSVALNWHAFMPPAEPREELQKIYRLFHGVAQVSDSGFSLALRAGADPVRLLGFTLIPGADAQTAAEEVLLAQIVQLGKYGAAESLGGILNELQGRSNDNVGDAFTAYWEEQILLLMEAETHFELRGWEWARRESGLGIFDRFHQAVMLLDGLLNQPDVETYPLYERALWLRGRLLYWLGRERGGPNEYEGGKRDFAVLLNRYPDDTLVAMYTGERIDLPDPCDELGITPGAPAWSSAQRELLCRLRRIVNYWVTERQAENGEFGGKLGDDVELLRWWTPVVLAGDTLALTGWKRLADGVWIDPKVYKGYARKPSDVEHSSEFIADTAPAMALYSEEPLYTERLRYSVDYFENLWTGESEHGHRFFRSAWFSSSEIETQPPKNRDLEYNCRAVKAVRYYAWKTREPGVIKSLHKWSQAWVSAAMRTDKGKPAGIIPASVRFPDEAINGDEPNWYQANMYWDYFDWEHHAGSMMLDQLLFTSTLVGDTSLLEPMYAALELVNASEKASTGINGPAEPGSPGWAAEVLRRERDFWSVVAQWRLLTDDNRYDHLIVRHGTPYVRYRLTGDEQHLVDGLEYTLNTVRYNTPLLTSEAVHTDRVYAPGSEHLKAMLTGDEIPESSSPYYVVSWEGTDDDFTALVTRSEAERIGVQLFSHNMDDRQITMRVWQLAPGDYQVTQKSSLGHLQVTDFRMTVPGERFSLKLPPRELLVLNFEPR